MGARRAPRRDSPDRAATDEERGRGPAPWGRSEGRRAAREARVGAAGATAAPSAAETAARLEIQREVVTAVLGLREPHRTAIVMRFYDGLGPTEIARRLDRPEKTVSSWIARGLAELRRRLDDRRGGRRAWCVPLLGTGGVTTSLGVFLVSSKTKIAVALVLLLLAGLASWRVLAPERASHEPSAPVAAPPELPDLAEAPESTPAGAPTEGTSAPGAGTGGARDAGGGASPGWALDVHGIDSRGGDAIGATAEFQSPGRESIKAVTDGTGLAKLEVVGPGHVFVAGVGRQELGMGEELAPPDTGEMELTIRLEKIDPFGPTETEQGFGSRAGYVGRGGHRFLRAGGGGAKTQGAVNLGLQWLCEHQQPQGGWTAGDPEAEVAVTGLALLAFLAGGETHLHGKDKRTLRSAIGYFLRRQQVDGSFDDGRIGDTGHPIATLALLEALGLTGSTGLKPAVEAGLAHLDQRRCARPDGEAPWGSFWPYLTVAFAKAGVLAMPHGLFAAAKEWAAQPPAESGDTVAFPPSTDDARSAARLWLAGLLGNRPEGRPRFRPSLDDPGLLHFGTLEAFHRNEKDWKSWNERMKRLLTESQRTDGDEKGSWDPKGPQGAVLGRAGVTALYAMTLETYYRFARDLKIEAR